jgi:hypothetical protein
MHDDKQVGILFVHGIGNQAQGDTLLECAEPLYQWLVRWLEGSEPIATGSSAESVVNNSVHIIDADIQASNDSPAYTQWLLRIKQGDGKIKETRLLLAEARWAGSIMTPSFWASLKWAFQVGPSIALLHFTTLIKNVKRNSHGNFYVWLLSLLAIPFYILASMILMQLVTGLALTLAIASSIASFLPFPELRSLVAYAQFILSNWIGDAYLLTTSPIQFAAMLSKFRKDLNWMDERCEKIAVVAHSQGTAIAYHALLKDKPRSVQRFLTYGSAIKILDRIKKTRSQGLDWLAIVYTGVILVFSIYLFIYRNEWLLSLSTCYVPNRDYLDMNACKSMFLPGVFIFIVSALYYLMHLIAEGILTHNPLSEAHRLGQDKAFRWIDMYASHDPAPNGPISDKFPDFIQSKAIYNRSNLITDHSTYWSNVDQFISAVACVISELTSTGFMQLTIKDGELIKQAQSRRRWRANWLSASRNLFLVSGLVLLLTYWSQLPQIGRQVANVLGRGVNLIPETVEINRFLLYLNATELQALGGLAIFALPLIWYLWLRVVWHLWETAEVSSLFKRQMYDYGGSPFILLFTSIAALLVFNLMAVVYKSLTIGKLFELIGQNVVAPAAIVFLLGSFLILPWFVENKKLIRAIVSAVLLAALIFSLLTLFGLWYWELVFYGVIPAIFIFIILFERRIDPNRLIGARFSKLLTKWSLEETGEASAAGIHAKKLDAILLPISKYFRGSRGFLAGLTAFIFSLLQWRLNVWGAIFLLSFFSFIFSIDTLAEPTDSKFLRALSLLGLVLALLSPVLFWILAF